MRIPLGDDLCPMGSDSDTSNYHSQNPPYSTGAMCLGHTSDMNGSEGALSNRKSYIRVAHHWWNWQLAAMTCWGLRLSLKAIQELVSVSLSATGRCLAQLEMGMLHIAHN